MIAFPPAGEYELQEKNRQLEIGCTCPTRIIGNIFPNKLAYCRNISLDLCCTSLCISLFLARKLLCLFVCLFHMLSSPFLKMSELMNYLITNWWHGRCIIIIQCLCPNTEADTVLSLNQLCFNNLKSCVREIQNSLIPKWLHETYQFIEVLRLRRVEWVAGMQITLSI